ncbi:fatty acid desaturase [Ruegeria sp.]|uniref:fatty acid desaturase n=1 Tax=Ruegeria sp. TaxID=1879320 RepID=UPI003C7AC666
MTTDYVATNAASSGIKIDRKALKSLAKRSDRPGLVWLAKWVALMIVSGIAIHYTLGTWWIILTMGFYASALGVAAYSLSHETAHGTAFRTRWLNETVLWISSFLYFGEPYHRRYAHTSHHTKTWHVGEDGQMPFDTPMTFGGWLIEQTGLPLLWYEAKVIICHAFGFVGEEARRYTPDGEIPKLIWGARAFLLGYLAIAVAIAMGQTWLAIYFVIPRILGGFPMQLFTTIQHAELQENDPSILKSTRSFSPSFLGRFLYMNMHNHVEHHLYPQVPFYSLPELHEKVKDQVPQPDPGLIRTNWELLVVVIKRSLGMNTKAPTIRQAPHMVTEGGFEPVAKASMR